MSRPSFDWTPYAAPYDWPGNSCVSLLRAVCRHVGSPVPPSFFTVEGKTERGAVAYAKKHYGGVLEGYGSVLRAEGWRNLPEDADLAPFDVVLGSFLYDGGETAPQPAVVREDHRITGFTLHGLDTVDAVLSAHGRMRFERCPQR